MNDEPPPEVPLDSYPSRWRGVADSNFRSLFILIFAVGASTRFWELGGKSLWFDEAWSWFVVQGSLGEMLERIEIRDAHPPLYYLILWSWVRLGDSELMLRLPSALFGVASLPLIYFAARHIAGPVAGLTAMAFLAVAPFHVKHSQEARFYSLLFFLCLLSLTLMLLLVNSPRNYRLWIAKAGVTTAIVYTQYIGLFYLLGELALGLAWGRNRSGFRRAWLLSTAVSVLLYLPWCQIASRHVGRISRNFWIPKSTPEGVIREVVTLLSNVSSAEVGTRIFACAPLLVAALAAPLVCRRKELWSLLGVATLPVALLGGIGAFVSIFSARGLIFVLGPLLILAAVSVSALPSRGWRAGVTLLVLLGSVPGLRGVYGAFGKQNWRDGVAFVQREAQPGDLTLFDPGFLDIPFKYYGAGAWREKTIAVDFWGMTAPAVQFEAAAAFALKQPRVWIVRTTNRSGQSMADRLAGEFSKQKDIQFGTVSIIRLER